MPVFDSRLPANIGRSIWKRDDEEKTAGGKFVEQPKTAASKKFGKGGTCIWISFFVENAGYLDACGFGGN